MRSPVSTLVALSILASPAVARAQLADPARAPVQGLCDALIGIMKGGKTLGVAGRARAIGPVIDRSFDLPLMTRLLVGTAWTTIAPADQMALTAAFRRMTIAQYAGNFDSFGGESFAVLPQVETRGGDKLVRTNFIQPRNAPIAIGYRMRQSGASWKIIDVYYKDSISQLATRRADFARVLAAGGARALIGHLDALAAKAAG